MTRERRIKKVSYRDWQIGGRGHDKVKYYALNTFIWLFVIIIVSGLLWWLGELLGQNLDGDFPLQLGVLGTVDLSHAPLANLLQDFVMVDGCPDHEVPQVEKPAP